MRRTNDELRTQNKDLNGVVTTLKQSISGFDVRLDAISREHRQQLEDVCIVLRCIVLYCIVLYCIVLYCIVLYCIV